MDATLADASPVALEASTTRLAQYRRLGSEPALDGLRGAAVLLVIAFHSTVLTGRRLLPQGGLGVDAFFVLSGFLITALLLREETTDRVRFGRFYRRRAFRLLPALVVLLGVHAVYAAATHSSGSIERSSVVATLLYDMNTSIPHRPISEGLGHLWSLSVEEQFYVVWPACIVLFFGLRRRLPLLVAGVIALIAVIALRRAQLYHEGSPTLFLYIGTTTRADSLVVGALLAMLWVRRKTPTRGLRIAIWPAIFFFLYVVVRGASDAFLYYGGYTLIAIAIAIVILGVIESTNPVRSFLSTGPLRAVGRVSYGLYIWHLPVFVAVLYFFGRWSPGLRVAAGLGITSIVCVLSWFLVEQPFLRWKERLDGDRRELDAPVPVTGSPTVEVAARRSKRAPLGAVAIVLLAIVVGLVGLSAARSNVRTTRHTWPLTHEIVTVPQLVNHDVFGAAAALNRKHLNWNVRSAPSARVRDGRVSTQSPAAGSRVRSGTTVTVVFSTGADGAPAEPEPSG